MPRSLAIDTEAYFQNDVLELAYLWVIERLDAQVYRLTSHNEDLVIDGDTYSSVPGIDPFAFSSSANSGVDNTEFVTTVTSDCFSTLDILQGRFDGAMVTISLCSWSNLSLTPVLLIKGYLGEMQVQGQGFKCEIRGIMQRAAQVIGECASETCRVREFGDVQCGLDTASTLLHSHGKVIGTLDAVSFKVVIYNNYVTPITAFERGKFTWDTGDNAGLSFEIVSISEANMIITLSEPMYGKVVLDDTFTIIRGCDRTFATCVALNNAVNFRGEPHVPGTDAILKPLLT